MFESLFIFSGAYLLLNAASYDGEILQTDACRLCAGHLLGSMSIGVVVTKIMTFFEKCVHVGLDFCCGDLRGVVGRYDRRRRLASWLAAAGCRAAGCLAAYWTATVTSQACPYLISPLAGSGL